MPLNIYKLDSPQLNIEIWLYATIQRYQFWLIYVNHNAKIGIKSKIIIRLITPFKRD